MAVRMTDMFSRRRPNDTIYAPILKGMDAKKRPFAKAKPHRMRPSASNRVGRENGPTAPRTLPRDAYHRIIPLKTLPKTDYSHSGIGHPSDPAFKSQREACRGTRSGRAHLVQESLHDGSQIVGFLAQRLRAFHHLAGGVAGVFRSRSHACNVARDIVGSVSESRSAMTAGQEARSPSDRAARRSSHSFFKTSARKLQATWPRRVSSILWQIRS
jgi:hypothetical protein